MEKLAGLITGLGLILTGSISLAADFPPFIASALIFAGLGTSIHFERRVRKEASEPVERKASAVFPSMAELSALASLVYVSGFYELGFIYLGLVLLKTEVYTGLDEIAEFSSSRLMGRVARMVILGLGMAAAEVNSFVYFYALVGAGLTAVYDILVILAETSSGI